MAANELGSYPVLDFTFKNATASTIAANLAVLASTAPTGDTPGCVVLPTASGGVVGTIGVTVEAIPAGGVGRVRVYGIIPCTANGTVTFGEHVQVSDTSAKLGWVKTCGAATQQLGKALDTATNGQQVRVLLMMAANA